MEKNNEMEIMIRQLENEKSEAIEMLRIIREMEIYPDLPMLITKIGIPLALNVPIQERKNLIHFMRVIWERELHHAEYFIEKLNWQIVRERNAI